ncbi:MAG: GMC family oxidoreductase [Deltaproteobacteria bacterium]|nr:GMC family oxidoreductase [Deltaproteobacteria bacterium]
MRVDRRIDADAVIIGSGAAGAVVASALAVAGAKVIVLEEGPRATAEDLHGDPARAVRRFYRNAGAVVSIGAPPISIQVGRAVGGSTLINGGTCFRTPDHVLHAWSEALGGAFRPQDLDADFLRVEGVLAVQPVAPDQAFVGERRLLEAALSRGDRGGYVKRNVRACQGSHLCPFVCPTDAKQSVDKNYLRTAEAAGAQVLADTTALRIVMEGPRAIGVLAAQADGAGLLVRAPIVTLAAGALHSPVLLRRSLGWRTPRAVGRSLFLHPGAHVAGIFNEPVVPRRGPIQSIYVSGPDDGYVIYGMGYPPEVFSVFTLEAGGGLQNLARFERSVTLAVMAADHGSRGQLRGLGAMPLPLYAIGRDDAQQLVNGMAHAAELLLGIGATSVYVSVRGFGPLTTAADVARLRAAPVDLRRLVLGSVHPMGTAPMGLDPNASALDPDLRPHGTRGLYVPDASFFPSSLGVNPQITIMAFAERAARHMLQTL